MPETYEIDRADPGYQRACIAPECPQAFNVLDIMVGPPAGNPAAAAGWFYGPQMFGGYVCPRHAPAAREHTPEWVRVDDVVTGCACQCQGWMWLPGRHQTMGAFKERWAGHIDVETQRAEAAHA